MCHPTRKCTRKRIILAHEFITQITVRLLHVARYGYKSRIALETILNYLVAGDCDRVRCLESADNASGD